jgi:hypothetical protein
MANAEAKGFSDLGLEERVIQLQGVVEMFCSLFRIPFVVVAEAAIKNDQRRIIRSRQALKKAIVLAQVKIAV